VKLTPKSKYSGYSFIDTYITTDNFLSVYNEYYNKKEEMFKRDSTTFKSFDGKSYVSTNLKVINLKNGKSTVVNWSDYDFNPQFEESTFIINNLKRAKF
jgi:outer membrane lipoprotein-sorting protein